MEILIVLLLIIAAVGAVMAPLLRRDAGAPDPLPATRAQDEGLSMAFIECEVARYREALRAGTVCGHCVQANPPGSRFCSDCGRPLAPAPATTSAATTT